MPLSDTVLMLVGLLLVAIVAAGVFRNLPIPHTVILVIIGMVLGGVAQSWAPLAPLGEFRLSPDLVFFVFLPALIFESGFNLDARQLVKNLAPVLVLAVPALVISTSLVGAGLWLVLDLDLRVALLFGALISATDPVAVIALFKELGAPERLTVLVEGESLLNDATAIVVFTILLTLVAEGGELSWSDSGQVAGEFLRVFVGGAVVGALLGLVLSELLYHLRSGIAAILTMSLVIAYASFILAEHALHVSGVMAAAAAAIALAGFGMTRFRHEATVAIGEIWEVIALICNSLLFLLVGLSVAPTGLGTSIGPIVVAVVLVIAARAASVYTLVPPTTKLFRLPHISIGERHIMWWGGLKGGLAIAIVLSIPEDLPGRELLLNMTLGVVLFTLLVNAPTIRPLMSRLRLDQLSVDERVELRHALVDAHGRAEEALERFTTAGLIPEAGRREVEITTKKTFETELLDVEGDQQTRDTHLAQMLARRMESSALEELYDMGVIPQYIFVDMRHDLHRRGDADHTSDASHGDGIIARLEKGLMRRLREKNWASGILAGYQTLRLAQHLQREMGNILVCQSVLALLRQREDLDEEARKTVAAPYEARLTRGLKVEAVQREFPAFYKRFSSRLCTRVALASGLRHARHGHHHGELGAKAYNIIERRVHAALMYLPSLAGPLYTLTPRDLRAMAPLLADLPQAELEALVKHARPVAFLAGDVITGEQEKGDAFYIIVHGEVSVFKRADDGEEQLVGTLGDGDAFGETSLLQERLQAHERTATIKAATPCTVLRLSRQRVRGLLDANPGLKQRLEEINRARTGGNAGT